MKKSLFLTAIFLTVGLSAFIAPDGIGILANKDETFPG
jgi:hypothetical protein